MVLMKIWGKEETRENIEKRIPDIQKICGPRYYELTEGACKGTRVADVDTGTLRYSVVLDRGMDISLASYRGINLTHLTENGEVHPSFYESYGKEWARIFFGGMMTTCGLTYFGPPGRDGDEELGLHGRYSAIPVRNFRDMSGWDGDEYIIILQGQMDETVQLGNKMRLERTVKSNVGEAAIHIYDTVTNKGAASTPFTLLYHINFGFPMLDEGTRIIIASDKCIPFDAYSQRRQEKRFYMEEPKKDVEEENYFLSALPGQDGKNIVFLVNDRIEIGVYIKTSADTLPYFCEWKMMGERDYTLAIEPCNVQCENRGVLRKKGLLPILESGEQKKMDLEIGIAEGKDEIRILEEKIKKIRNGE